MSASSYRDADIPLGALLETAHAAADLRRLVLLDAAWAAAVGRGDGLDDRDRASLVAFGSDFDAQLATVERHAYALRHLFERHGESVNRMVASALGDGRFTATQTQDFRRALGVGGDDFARQGITAANLLIREVPTQRERLLANVSAIRRGESAVVVREQSVLCSALSAEIISELLHCTHSAIHCAGATAAMAAAVAAGCHH